MCNVSLIIVPPTTATNCFYHLEEREEMNGSMRLSSLWSRAWLWVQPKTEKKTKLNGRTLFYEASHEQQRKRREKKIEKKCLILCGKLYGSLKIGMPFVYKSLIIRRKKIIRKRVYNSFICTVGPFDRYHFDWSFK